MKRTGIFYLIFLLSFIACEKNDSTIDSILKEPPVIYFIELVPERYNIENLIKQNPSASEYTLTFNILINSYSRLDEVNYDVNYLEDYTSSPQGKVMITEVLPSLNSNEMKSYKGNFSFKIKKTNLGKYIVTFDAHSGDMISNHLIKEFVIENKLNNPPVITKITSPDTITVVSTTERYQFLATVTDADGLDDINTVLFNTTKPDGSASSGNPFIMQNEGNGIYSYTFDIPPNFPPAQKGKYKYVYQAFDKSGAGSNIIIYYVVIR